MVWPRPCPVSDSPPTRPPLTLLIKHDLNAPIYILSPLTRPDSCNGHRKVSNALPKPNRSYPHLGSCWQRPILEGLLSGGAHIVITLLVTPIPPLNSINPSVKASVLAVPLSQLFLSIKVQNKPLGLSLITFSPILTIFFHLLPCGRMVMRLMGSTTSLSLLTRLCLCQDRFFLIGNWQKEEVW